MRIDEIQYRGNNPWVPTHTNQRTVVAFLHDDGGPSTSEVLAKDVVNDAFASPAVDPIQPDVRA